ncbi:MAG TPA: hypothetical protein PLK30_03410 [Blastocatellia bacterium]|nr:hypothetical protein [Blastocatellia bacterium]
MKLLALLLPLLFWQGGLETAPALKQAGIERIAVTPEKADEWRKAGFEVVPMTEAELKSREKLLVPGANGRPGLAAATGRPWVDANGWHFTRNPAGKFYYELPKGRAALAAAECFAYNGDAVLKIDPADLAEIGRMFAFFKSLPVAEDLPLIADIGVIDDGSALVGEVMNLLSRRNLLFKPVKTPSPQLRLNIRLGTKAYPRAAAADPSEFALTVRSRLTDEARMLRIYGSEVVVARLTGDSKHIKLHLLNYGRRDFDGMRIRLRGVFGKGSVFVSGQGKGELTDFEVSGQVTEFSMPRMSNYALIELPRIQ